MDYIGIGFTRLFLFCKYRNLETFLVAPVQFTDAYIWQLLSSTHFLVVLPFLWALFRVITRLKIALAFARVVGLVCSL